MEHKFKAFDKVLVRDGEHNIWKCAFFSHYGEGLYFTTDTNFSYQYCLSFEGNEHLAGTTDDPVKPKLKVVRGNAKRGNDVIKLLEGIGGINKSNCKGKNDAAFYHISKRGVICCCIDNSMFFNGFNLEILELPEPKRWRAEKGDYYYYVDFYGDVQTCFEENVGCDNLMYERGNYFETEEGAKLMADKIKKLFNEENP